MAKDELTELTKEELKVQLSENYDFIIQDIEENALCPSCEKTNFINLSEWRFFINHKKDFIFSTSCKACAKEMIKYKSNRPDINLLGDFLK